LGEEKKGGVGERLFAAWPMGPTAPAPPDDRTGAFVFASRFDGRKNALRGLRRASSGVLSGVSLRGQNTRPTAFVKWRPHAATRGRPSLPRSPPLAIVAANERATAAEQMAEETVLNLFVSSPGDVQAERERVDLAVERLNAEFAGRVRIRAIRWETRYYSSHETFQTQIPEASACDLVVAIFGARLGSPLPEKFPHMPSGEPYPSGSAYEVLSAIEARRRGQGVPDVYVFRRPRAPLVALDAADRDEIEAQWRRLTGFFETWFRSRSGEFLAAFQEFRSTDEFAAKVEDCLRQWLARRGFASEGSVWDRARLGSPFPGLAAFDEGRQSVFFGRGLFIDQAIRRLRELEAPTPEASRPSFLLLIGASGSGKSSLLRAGLAPRIVMPGVFPEVELWRRAVVSVNADPFAALASALVKPEALGPELGEGPFAAAGLLAKQLAGDPDAAVAPVKDALTRAAATRAREANFETPRPARLFLALDQAERLLSETPPEIATRFAALIAAFARLKLATVVVALRSDAYAGFQALAPLVALRDAGASLDLLPPTASELEEMATRPAALCQPPLAFERRDGGSLAAELVADARGGDALPLLQMTLSRLAAAETARNDGVLRFADYRGMGAAVTETADEALAGLGAVARSQLPNLIAGLVRDVAVDPVTGAPTPVIGALDRATFEADRPERRALIEAFVAKRLLTAEGDAASQRVRPTHEALLRIWPEATAIIAEAAQLLRVRHALAPLARDWAEAGEADKPRHLDISPALLDGAERYIERFADEVPLATRAFVAAASAAAAMRRDRELAEQRRRAADAEAIAAANKRIAQGAGVGLAIVLVLMGLAGWQWRVAQQQRDRAERSLTLATATADGLVFDLAQKFRNVAGVPKDVIKDMLDKARSLQEQLLGAGESNAKLTANHAAAMGEIAVTELSLGDAPLALELAGDARGVYQRLVDAAPSDLRYVHDLAYTDETIGDVKLRQGDFDGAEAAYGLARTTVEAAIARGATDPQLARDQSLILQDLGALKRARGDLNAALALYRDAQAIAQSLADAAPNDAATRHGLAVAHRNVGDVLLQQKVTDAAATEFDAASAIAARLAAENPDDTLLQRDYTLSQERLGDTRSVERDYSGALKAYSEGEATAVALSAADPGNLEWRYDVAIGRIEIGDAQAALGDLAGAEKSFADAVAIDKALTGRDATNAQWSVHYWTALDRLGAALAKGGDQGSALAPDRDALAFAEAAATRLPADADWTRRVAQSAGKVGDALLATDHIDDALAADREAVARLDALPGAAQSRDDLFLALTRLGGALSLKHDVAAALDAYGRAETLARAMVADDPRTPARRGQLATLLVSKAHMLGAAGRDADTLKALNEAVALTRALAAEDPAQPLWVEAGGIALDRLAEALQTQGDETGALAAYRASLAAADALPPALREGAEARTGAATTEEAIAAILEARKDFAGALAAARAAIALRRGLADDAPADATRRRAELIDLNLAGRLANLSGDPKTSLAAFRDGLDIARTLAARSDARDLARSDLALSLLLVGGMLSQTGDAAGAATTLAEGLPIAQALVAAAPTDAQYRRVAYFVALDLGDARLAQAGYTDALAAYVAARDAAAAALAANGQDAEAAARLKTSVAKIGLLANAMLIARDFTGALAALDQARPAAPEQNWLDLVRAAALMFLGRSEEARALYDKHRGEKTYGGKTWEAAALEGFASLRAKGLTSPLMDEVAASFAPN
jgi:tetratricopeptide (TPR) repeat protein